MIKPNVGNIDKSIRILLGLLFLVLGIFIFKNYQVLLILIGIVLLLTGIFRFCGLYVLLGINTCKRK